MLQTPLFDVPSGWTLPDLNSLPSWAGVKRIGVDVETKDPDIKQMGCGVRRPGTLLAGVSFSFEDGPKAYLPLRHLGGANLEPEKVLQYLRDQAKVYTGTIVGANLPYDLDWLAQSGVVFRRAEWFRDVQVADPLINELQKSYSLDSIAKRYGFTGKDETLLKQAAQNYKIKNIKAELWKLPARYVGAYAEEDATLPLRILRKQERILEEEDLWGVYNLESRVLPVLVKMRRRGVRVNLEKLGRIEEWCLLQEMTALKIVSRETGVVIAPDEIWQAAVLERALAKIGVVPGRTTQDKAQIDKFILKAADHPVASALLRARQINKIRTTFAASVRRYVVNGRVHCTFNQLRKDRDDESLGGAAYGRLSSENFNLQQQPAKDPELGPMWRDIYEPEDGQLWAALDYSQQEPRMVVHFAEICRLAGATAAGERYRTDPQTDNHNLMVEMVHGEEATRAADKAQYKKWRGECKQIFLGLCYGMGGARLCRDLGLPTEMQKMKDGRMIEVAGPEGGALLRKFNSAVPYVKKLARLCEKRALSRGYIVTLSGRRCRFPVDPTGAFDWCHKALNRLIQGSSADQTKEALVALDDAGYRPQLQVHDEIDTSVDSPERAQAAAVIMETIRPLSIPSRVDVEIGKSWGTAK